MIYLLDTNIVSYIIKSYDLKLLDRFEEISKTNKVALSSIVVAELLYGVRKKGSKKLEEKVLGFISPFDILPFDIKASKAYSILRTNLEKKGKPIGAYDILIASHAISLNATLITNNTKEFCKVEDLKVEDWTNNKSKDV